ncbi:MAG: tetratricopeptide repeat protein, partial [Mesorhizobium sp.]|nr:tetratricopeptide repeat protein [Mesorhizobium sp.]
MHATPCRWVNRSRCALVNRAFPRHRQESPIPRSLKPAPHSRSHILWPGYHFCLHFGTNKEQCTDPALRDQGFGKGIISMLHWGRFRLAAARGLFAPLSLRGSATIFLIFLMADARAQAIEPLVQQTRDPAAAKILIERAEMRLSKYDAESALVDFDKAISLDPDNVDAYVGRSRAKMLKGDRTGAVADCLRAVARDPDRVDNCPGEAAGKENDLARNQPKPPAVDPNFAVTDDSLAAKAQEAKDPRALQAVLGGDAFLDMGMYDKAIDAYDHAIALDPAYRFAYFGRGNAAIAKHDYRQAIADYDQAILLEPRDGYNYNGRGAAWLAKGRLDKAFADYDQAVGLYPADAISLFNRGRVHFYRQEFSLAKVDFDSVMNLQPRDPYGALWRELAARRTGSQGALAADAANLDLARWPGPIVKLFLEQLT